MHTPCIEDIFACREGKKSCSVTSDGRLHCAQNEEFVKVLNVGVVPHTRNVRGSNYSLISVFPDRLAGRAIIISVVSHLYPSFGMGMNFVCSGKGASPRLNVEPHNEVCALCRTSSLKSLV
jgi:hypothetical protein